MKKMEQYSAKEWYELDKAISRSEIIMGEEAEGQSVAENDPSNCHEMYKFKQS